MKKEIFALTLSAVMAAGTCSIPVMAADDTYNVGICQLVQHEALDAATQGFKDALTEEFGDKVTLMSRMHREIPIPVPPLSIILFLMMWI